MPPGVGASYIVAVQQTSGEALVIGEENSYASRLWSLEEFYGTSDMRERTWTYVVIDGRIGLGGAEGRYQCFYLYFCFAVTLAFSVSFQHRSLATVIRRSTIVDS